MYWVQWKTTVQSLLQPDVLGTVHSILLPDVLGTVQSILLPDVLGAVEYPEGQAS